MNLTFRPFLSKIAFLIVTLTLCVGGSTYAEPRDSRLLSPGPIRPDGLDYRTEVPQGYLEVYSATDEFDDGGVPYHPHSSYVIYNSDGKIVKSVENHISQSDELPEIVTLVIGAYIIEARSNRDGYVRVAVVIKAGQRTTLDLELGQPDALTRLARSGRQH
jgi:hypothetical protein